VTFADAPASLTKEESIPGAVEKNLSFSAFSEAATQRMGNKPAVVHLTTGAAVCFMGRSSIN
jgi:hypothetical protein